MCFIEREAQGLRRGGAGGRCQRVGIYKTSLFPRKSLQCPDQDVQFSSKNIVAHQSGKCAKVQKNDAKKKRVKKPLCKSPSLSGAAAH